MNRQLWRPTSGLVSHAGCAPGTCRTLWRVIRDYPPDGRPAFAGSFEEVKRSDGKLWTCGRYETARDKADKLNAAAP